MYLLDTDICSYFMRGQHGQVADKMRRFGWGELKVSTIVQYELESGARRSPRSKMLIAVVESFLSRIEILPFDVGAARHAARVRADLASVGKPIGFYDTLISGHALSLGATLVTNNVDEFSRVDGLRLENWAA